MFRLSAMATLTGGTMFLVWLANQITLRGVGNGLALILLVGIVVEAPRALLDTIILGRQGVLSADAIAWLAALIAATVMLIVLMELARRRLPLEFPRRRIGGREIEGRSYLSLKLNGAGTIPVIFASWLLAVPLTIAAFGAGDGPAWWVAFTRHFGPGQLPYMAVYAALIVVCAYVYTAMILDPENAAADLKRYGGLVPGIEAGEATAAHIDHVLSRTTLVGALYLALICLIPEFLIWYMRVPFYFGGLSLLVVVCAILDLRAQIQGYVLVKLGS
jgi:preprotein translocase subunit SecY